MHEVCAAELLEELRNGSAVEVFAGPTGGAVVVRVDSSDPEPDEELVDALTSLPFIVVATGAGCGADTPAENRREGWQALADLTLEDDESLGDITATVSANPRASVALVLLLRGHVRRTAGDSLVAESSVFSMLQAGPEFHSWRAGRPVRTRPGDGGPRVAVERTGDTLTIRLDRPQVRNALDSRMRDELLDALRIAELDPSVARVVLAGEGPAFCSGGDLDEFGSHSDPATAHVVRLHRSIGRTILGLGKRMTVHMHGPCAGSGVEMAAFAHRVVARDDTTFALPEVSLGLIPGAGGTVSVPARIGRHRTAWLALSGRTIDASTARLWGLVDEIHSHAHPA